jgi:hypothetical protein
LMDVSFAGLAAADGMAPGFAGAALPPPPQPARPEIIRANRPSRINIDFIFFPHFLNCNWNPDKETHT